MTAIIEQMPTWLNAVLTITGTLCFVGLGLLLCVCAEGSRCNRERRKAKREDRRINAAIEQIRSYRR